MLGHSKSSLEHVSESLHQVLSTLSDSGTSLESLEFQQEKGFNYFLPLLMNKYITAMIAMSIVATLA